MLNKNAETNFSMALESIKRIKSTGMFLEEDFIKKLKEIYIDGNKLNEGNHKDRIDFMNTLSACFLKFYKFNEFNHIHMFTKKLLYKKKELVSVQETARYYSLQGHQMYAQG